MMKIFKHMLGTNKTHVHDENLGLSFDKKKQTLAEFPSIKRNGRTNQ